LQDDCLETCAMMQVADPKTELPLGRVVVAEFSPGTGEAAQKRRLVQAQALAKELKKFGPTSPLIVCIELNEDPFTTGGAPEEPVSPTSPTSPASPTEGPANAFESLCHNMRVRSVYASGQGYEAPYTRMDGKSRSCQNFILGTSEIKAYSLWSIPELPDESLPAINYPSNHLALASELRWPVPKE